MNLDRFSVKLDSERLHTKEFYEMFRESEEHEVKTCCGCGLEIDVTESFVESELYDEEYIHDLDECVQAYYLENKKDLNGEFKSLQKAI